MFYKLTVSVIVANFNKLLYCYGTHE